MDWEKSFRVLFISKSQKECSLNHSSLYWHSFFTVKSLTTKNDNPRNNQKERPIIVSYGTDLIDGVPKLDQTRL